MRTLTLLAVVLTLVVIVVGAYVRLSDAGLGCPDWPLCYGKPLPADIADGDALAKAWKEMGHRYLAGGLGLLIAAIWIVGLRTRRFRGLASAIAALVIFQATLGKWTVTMLLKPAIVTAHLLGGMTILALLLWLWLSLGISRIAIPALKRPAAVALAVLAVQIALGGWVSANYAALACPDLPLCLGDALPPMDFANAFHVVRELGQTADGALLSREALTAIHWSHRLFAVVAFLVIGWASIRAFHARRDLGVAIAILLVLQVALGIANVALSLPLPLAAAHNAGAALLLACLVVLNFFAFRKLA
jgi:cytochrome c oxidase assembly protein subunit 15